MGKGQRFGRAWVVWVVWVVALAAGLAGGCGPVTLRCTATPATMAAVPEGLQAPERWRERAAWAQGQGLAPACRQEWPR